MPIDTSAIIYTLIGIISFLTGIVVYNGRSYVKKNDDAHEDIILQRTKQEDKLLVKYDELSAEIQDLQQKLTRLETEHSLICGVKHNVQL